MADEVAEDEPLLKADADADADAEDDFEQPPVPPAPGIIAPSGGEADCRICLERGPRSQMISPCACEGTMKYVHRGCLERWCAERARATCEVCGGTYDDGAVLRCVAAAQREQEQAEEERRRAALLWPAPDIEGGFREPAARRAVYEVRKATAVTLGVLLTVTLFVAHAPPLLGADADAPEVDALEAAGVTVALDQAAIRALARGGNRSDYFEPMALHRWYRAASHKHGRHDGRTESNRTEDSDEEAALLNLALSTRNQNALQRLLALRRRRHERVERREAKDESLARLARAFMLLCLLRAIVGSGPRRYHARAAG